MIIEQGEGAGKQDPTYLDTNWIAHFYKFEELACKKHLRVKHEHEAGFGTDEIEFTAEGVWPIILARLLSLPILRSTSKQNRSIVISWLRYRKCLTATQMPLMMLCT